MSSMFGAHVKHVLVSVVLSTLCALKITLGCVGPGVGTVAVTAVDINRLEEDAHEVLFTREKPGGRSSYSLLLLSPYPW